ncbi:MAG: hypothetical protein Q8L75_15540 [Acidobacteriota bacterium]|nr:hypothetical protein [Acidobacteriota bacterium]
MFSAEPPPSSPALPVVETRLPAGPAYTPLVPIDQAQPTAPPVDFTVEVIGNLPLQLKFEDLTRLLGRRQARPSFNRTYPPTILELITLVKRNPEKPRDRPWNSIKALTMRYDEATGTVSVEYCVEHCGHDPRTGAFEPRRRMVWYHAREATVVAKVDKKLRDLAKYAER